MDYAPWLKLFGHTSEDPAVKKLLSSVGIKKIAMPDDEDDVRKDIPGMTLIFTDGEVLEDLEPVGKGSCVLTGVILRLSAKKEPYRGPLPLGIAASASQAEMRKKFGKTVPSESEGDQWKVENNLVLQTTYSSGGKGLEALLLSLPAAITG
jgi:hypothetical protein